MIFRVITIGFVVLLPALASAQPMVVVPGGAFVMGSPAGEADEKPAHRRRLPAFAVDVFEVTQVDYDRCVAAKKCTPRRKYEGTEGPKRPAVGVSWFQARAYCRFRGARLPSEAQWERAARGTDRRTYPWGNKLSCKYANFGNYDGAGRCAGKNPGTTMDVGSRPAGKSPVGAHDMGGNAWEWTATRHRPYPGARVKGGRRAVALEMVLRGGSCCSYFVMPRAANRLPMAPSYRDRDVGFRCARDEPAPAKTPNRFGKSE